MVINLVSEVWRASCGEHGECRETSVSSTTVRAYRQLSGAQRLDRAITKHPHAVKILSASRGGSSLEMKVLNSGIDPYLHRRANPRSLRSDTIFHPTPLVP